MSTPLGAKPTPSTAQFLALLNKYRVPVPVEEWRPLPFRRFRVDFAWPDHGVVLEQEGGVFTRGAHGSVSGILRDIEKYNLLTLHGLRVLRVLPGQLCTVETVMMIRQALGLPAVVPAALRDER